MKSLHAYGLVAFVAVSAPLDSCKGALRRSHADAGPDALAPAAREVVDGGAMTAAASPVVDAGAEHPTPHAANPGGPRLGKYNLLLYGAGPNFIYIGRIDLLPGGRYGVSRTAGGPYYGEGSYSFDAAASRVIWLSGPMHDEGWQGAFSVERGGKTHKIRVRPTTIASNSTDA